MPATVLCARANAQIDHGGHKYGANQSWWCPGFDQVFNTVTVVGSKPDELPVEHELIDGAWYTDGEGLYNKGEVIAELLRFLGDRKWHRLGPVARYEAPAPEVKEPTGLGAVVRDANGYRWVGVSLNGGTRWFGDRGQGRDIYGWDSVKQPVIVLSEGVEL